jgi:hypothetical protein
MRGQYHGALIWRCCQLYGKFIPARIVYNYKPTTGCTGMIGNLSSGTPRLISQNPASITGLQTGGNSDVTLNCPSSSRFASYRLMQVSADGTNYTTLQSEPQIRQQLQGLRLPFYFLTPASPTWRNSIVSFYKCMRFAYFHRVYLYIGENITFNLVKMISMYQSCM